MTIALENQLDDARNERDAIRNEGAALRTELRGHLARYALKHGCKPRVVLDHIDDLVNELVDDATGPVSRRIARLEDEIGALEDKDLRRNSPIVI